MMALRVVATIDILRAIIEDAIWCPIYVQAFVKIATLFSHTTHIMCVKFYVRVMSTSNDSFCEAFYDKFIAS